MSDVLLLFDSTRAVIKAERCLEQAAIPCKVVPVPKEISSECGLAMLVSGNAARDAVSHLTHKGIAVKQHRQP